MSHLPHRTFPLVGACILSLRAAASTIIAPADNPSITAQMYRDEALLYQNVGKVSGSGFSGSGVLLSDRWVLTAGHVSLSKIGATFNVGGADYTVASVITHPNFSFSGPSYDLGLLYLSTPVTGVTAATLFHFDQPDSILGREATWVGHGFTGTGATGAQLPIEFRAFTNIIDVFGPSYGLTNTSFVADFDKPDGSTNAPSSNPVATRLEGNLASGDSGGGVFVTMDGKSYLVGINSYQAAFSAAGSNSKYGGLSGAANLNLFHQWIFQETGITAIPEPAIWWLYSLGCLAWCRRNR